MCDGRDRCSVRVMSLDDADRLEQEERGQDVKNISVSLVIKIYDKSILLLLSSSLEYTNCYYALQCISKKISTFVSMFYIEHC